MCVVGQMAPFRAGKRLLWAAAQPWESWEMMGSHGSWGALTNSLAAHHTGTSGVWWWWRDLHSHGKTKQLQRHGLWMPARLVKCLLLSHHCLTLSFLVFKDNSASLLPAWLQLQCTHLHAVLQSRAVPLSLQHVRDSHSSAFPLEISISERVGYSTSQRPGKFNS